MNAKTKTIEVAPHNFTHTGTEVLILRRVPANRTAHNGFVYPKGVDVVVEAPDFNRRCECGGGLHGWPWGFGLGEGQDFNLLEDIWLVLGAEPGDVIGELDGGLKCKCRKATIRYEGAFNGAMDFLRAGFAACVHAMSAMPAVAAGDGADSSKKFAQLAASGDAAQLAASGDAAQLAASGYAAQLAASGYAAKLAASGYAAKLAASGDAAQLAASGDAAKLAASGDAAKLAASGDAAKLAASGYAAKLAASGDAAQLAASGDAAKLAASGYAAKLAASGDAAQLAASGYAAQLAASGNDACAAIAAHGGKVKVGARGAFSIAYWDESTGWEFLTGKVGRDGIKAHTYYQVVKGKLVEC